MQNYIYNKLVIITMKNIKIKYKQQQKHRKNPEKRQHVHRHKHRQKAHYAKQSEISSQIK